MSHLPTTPTTGTEVPEGYDADLHDFIRELSARTSLNDIWVKYLLARISGGGGGGSPAVVPCQITSGSGLVYIGTVYDSYMGTAIKQNVKIMPMQLNYFYTIPPGTWVMAAEVRAPVQGDGSGV